MSAAIVALLSVLAQIIPALSNSTAITNIINVLISLIPVVVKEIQDVEPLLTNIINALRGNNVITDQQLKDLDDLEAKIDAEFEAAAAMPDDSGLTQ